MEDFSLTGKVAIVTGGNGGIGKAIAIGLAGAGADIVIAARNKEKTAGVVEEIKSLGRRCIGLECNVRKADDIKNTVEKTVKEFGKLNILVNNAGTANRALPQSMTEKEWDIVIDINLKAGFLFSQAAYPAMVKAGGGKIINIGSMMSIFGSGTSANYSVSKGGVIQLTKSLAIAWAQDNIQVNAICPGWFATDLTKQHTEDKELYRTIINRTPAGRFGETNELAGAAVFLSSAASSFVTGQSIVVDGGFSINAL
ncbi:MAG: glucose 1-dehydrogenase [Dehalococcoidales bacterium]